MIIKIFIKNFFNIFVLQFVFFFFLKIFLTENLFTPYKKLMWIHGNKK